MAEGNEQILVEERMKREVYTLHKLYERLFGSVERAGGRITRGLGG